MKVKSNFHFDLPAEASGTVTLYAYLPGKDVKRARRTFELFEPDQCLASLSPSKHADVSIG